jgi:hypothetical protein
MTTKDCTYLLRFVSYALEPCPGGGFFVLQGTVLARFIVISGPCWLFARGWAKPATVKELLPCICTRSLVKLPVLVASSAPKLPNNASEGSFAPARLKAWKNGA